MRLPQLQKSIIYTARNLETAGFEIHTPHLGCGTITHVCIARIFALKNSDGYFSTFASRPKIRVISTFAAKLRRTICRRCNGSGRFLYGDLPHKQNVER